MQCAREMKIKIPEDLRITGFDGINEAFRVTPNISTVCQSSVEKGVTAANMLINGDEKGLILP